VSGVRLAARSRAETAGLLGSSRAATCPRPTSGSPPVAGAAAAPMPRTRRQAAPAATVPQSRASTNKPACCHPIQPVLSARHYSRPKIPVLDLGRVAGCSTAPMLTALAITSPGRS
jgi:hypothetical protein